MGNMTPDRATTAPTDGTMAADGEVPEHVGPLERVLDRLRASDRGLAAEEAAARLERYGPNEIEAERETPWWRLLLHQFQDPLIYILVAAAAVTAILQDFIDTGVILAVVLLNAAIGFFQELRARQAMRGLARMSAPRAHVLRDGQPRDIPSRDLVPGDIVLLTSGDRVPGDLRLIRVNDLQVDESALTGESLAVRKSTDPLDDPRLVPGDRVNMAFAGTSVTRGRGRGIVVRTGAATELGRIAGVVRAQAVTRTPLQERVDRLGHQIGYALLGLVGVVLVLGLVRRLAPAEIFLTAVALAVSAIPEGLPVVLTVTLAIGVRRMAARNAIIRSLPAVETLGSTTVIASDKTGTLTRNEMTVRSIWAGGRYWDVSGAGYEAEGEILPARDAGSADAPDPAREALTRTLLAGVLASEASLGTAPGEVTGDPTEIALLVAAAKGGVPPDDARRRHRELDVLPFEPERRLMASLNAGPDDEAGAGVVFLKGAPEAILGRCDTMATPGGGAAALDPAAVEAAAAAFAADGLRVLAMAGKPAGDARAIDADLLRDGFTFLGLQGMEDPVRPEAVEAVRAAAEAGIRVIMVTGDHEGTARAIGARLGLLDGDAGVVEGRAIDGMDATQFAERVRTSNVFARVAPEHKLRIVQRLREAGEVVAVTGDGVNDAPALRAAHLGVAMGASGTDVAREASEMVLADDNFATITGAVEEGRVVFANIRKVTFFLLSTGVAEVAVIVAALVLGWPLPFIAAQILWINLVTNGLQDVALAFEPGEPGLLRRPPRRRDEDILTRRLLRRLGGVALVLGAGTLFSFWWTLRSTDDLDLARTVAMTQMVMFQFFHVLNCRSLDRSIFSIPPLSNRFLFVSMVLALAAHLAVLHVPLLQMVFRTVPLTGAQWGMITAIAFTAVIGGEIDKRWNRSHHSELG